jgi:hypothetical protein
MQIQTLVGVQNNTDSALPIVNRAGKQGEVMVSELHGRYYETTYRGNMYYAASQALVTTTVGLATTYTGLCIINPIASQRNAVVNKVSMMQSVLQATQVEAFAIAVGYNATVAVTNTTPLAVHNTNPALGVGAVQASISAGLPTAPFYAVFVENTTTATANASGNVIDLEGSIILPPGGYVMWVTPAQASVAGMWFSFQWEEVPL